MMPEADMAFVTTLMFTCLLRCLFVTGINVVFELKESGFNEVIFVGETNITIRCNASGLSGEFLIRIEHEFGGEIARTTSKNVLEHTIKQVSPNEGGMYTCNVSYEGKSGFIETETHTLHLNVQERSPQCFRNGTEGKPYQDGDLLLISCYCMESIRECFWFSTVPESSKGKKIDYNKTKHQGKLILRVLLRYNSTSVSSKTKFGCTYPSSIDCFIGPQDKSSQDVIINSHESSQDVTMNSHAADIRTKLPESGLLSTVHPPIDTTVYLKSTQTMLPKSISLEAELKVSIIGTTMGTSIFLIIIIIVAIGFMSRKRRKSENSGSVRRFVQVSPDDHVYTSNAHSVDRAYQNGNEQHQGSGDSAVYFDIGSMGEASGTHRDLPLSDNVEASVESTGDYADLDETKAKLFRPLQDSNVSSQNSLQNRPSREDEVTSGEMPGREYRSVRKGDVAQENFDTIYAKVDKYRKHSRVEMLQTEPNPIYSDGLVEQDLDALYAKIKKNKCTSRIETDDGITLENEKEDGIYAEIGKK